MEGFSTENLRFGERIKERRTELTLSLRDLAEITDLSTTFLSGLERGQANPTLASARRIAHALKVPLHRLLADSAEGDVVVTKDRRRQMLFPDSHVKYEILTPQLTRKMVLFLVRRASRGRQHHAAAIGRTHGRVHRGMEGDIEIQLAGQVYQLGEGDSIYFENRFMESIRAA